MTDTAKRIAEIEKRVSEATEGPWEWSRTGQGDHLRIGPDEQWMMPKKGTANFIAHSRADIPYLLEELRRKDRIIARLREALEFYDHEDIGFYREPDDPETGYFDPSGKDGKHARAEAHQALNFDGTQEAE